ncbi:MAG: TOBE domain-containing protein [Coriobacteriales bacterium]|jgi:molybdopterin-binding protein|nr:TOBE domain-containing protein [Coriobacteriales bacterium]
MKISARNQLKGVVQNIEAGAVNTIVSIKVGDSVIKASITNAAVADLGLEVGKEAYAIIKASSVMVGVEH